MGSTSFSLPVAPSAWRPLADVRFGSKAGIDGPRIDVSQVPLTDEVHCGRCLDSAIDKTESRAISPPPLDQGRAHG